MRLRKPTLVPQLTPTLTSPPFSTSALSHLSDNTLLDPLLEGNGLSGVAELPNGFGSMFVGTMFQGYVCLNNESEEEVLDVAVSAELRFRDGTGKVGLVPRITRIGRGEGGKGEGSVRLMPHEALHQIIEQSIPPMRYPPTTHASTST